jgi:hypothetical protein
MSAKPTPNIISFVKSCKDFLKELLDATPEKYREILIKAGFKNTNGKDCTRPRASTVFLALTIFAIFLLVSICGLLFPTLPMKRVVIVVNSLCGAVLVVVFATDLLTSITSTRRSLLISGVYSQLTV